MPFVEVFVPRGSLSDTKRKVITERLVCEVMVAEGAPDADTARSISWLIVHEADAWSVGGLPVGRDEPPRYVVRVTVPAGSMDDGKRAMMMERITAVLAEADDEPERLYASPVAWVHINEILEGNWGAMGRVVRFPDIAEFVLSGTPD